jgi:hypothetical protein
MRNIAAIFLSLTLLAGTCSAAFERSGGMTTAQSRSGLFSVRGPSVSWQSLYMNNFLGDRPLRLDPRLLTVACEEIKQMLLTKLGYPLPQQFVSANQRMGLSKIFIVLHPEADYAVTVSPVPSTTGLGYRVDMPNEMYPTRLTETIVQVLLIDIANQNNTGKPVEVPRWLTDGFIRYLQAEGLDNLPLEANLPVTKVKVRKDPISGMRERMKSRLPLTFEELSWPENLSKEKQAAFEDSAQLFVYELLRLKDGPIHLRRMVEMLPKHRNWQFAFLEAFHPNFGQLASVEKWWSLHLVDFAGRDPSLIWSREESSRQLDLTLQVPARVYSSTSAAPKRAEMTLQRVINEWDLTRQQETISKMMIQLQGLRLRVAPEFVGLVDDYRMMLEKYLTGRTRMGAALKRNANASYRREAICKELDRLDERRATLRKPAQVASK